MHIDHRYQVISSLGKGRTGEVFLVEDLSTHQQKALKLGTGDDVPLVTITSLLKNEFRTLAQFDHPGLPKAHEFGTTPGGKPYYTMAYLPGETLDAFWKGFSEKVVRDRNPHLAMAVLLEIGRQLAVILHLLHSRELIHGDIKPENILVHPPLEEFANDFIQVRLLDLSLARTYTYTPLKRLSGTPAFMAPETLFGQGVDNRSDLYSLGVVLYEMAYGRLPFETSEEMREYYRSGSTHPDLPHHFLSFQGNQVSGFGDSQAILKKLLSRNFTDRYTYAAEAAQALEETAKHCNLPLSIKTTGEESPDVGYLLSGPMTGQKAELEKLCGQVSQVKRDRTRQSTLITGPKGMGKSRLLSEFAARIGDSELPLFLLETGSANMLLRQLFFQFTAAWPNSPTWTTEETLLLSHYLPPELLSEKDTPTGKFAPTAFKSILEQILSKCLEAILTHKSSCLVIAVDSPAKPSANENEIIQILYNSSHQYPVFMVLACETAPEGLTFDTTVTLTPFTFAETQNYVASLLGRLTEPKRLAFHLHQKLNGHPLFIKETVKLLIQKKLLRFENGAWHLASEELEALPLAESLEAVTRQHLAVLSWEARQLLEYLALNKGMLPLGVLSELGQLNEVLPELTQQGLARVNDDLPALLLQHPALCDFLSRFINTGDKAAYHQQLADAYRKQPLELQEAAAERIAWHLELGQVGNIETGTWYKKAGDKALQTGSLIEALDYFQKGRRCLSEARAALDDETTEILFYCTLNAGNLLAMTGKRDEAERYYREALDIAHQLGNPKLQADCQGNLGNIAWYRGDLQKAEAHYTESAKFYREAEETGGLAGSLINLGNVAFYQSEYGKAKENYLQARELLKGIDDKRKLLVIETNLAGIFDMEGNYREALENYRYVQAERAAMGDRKGELKALLNTCEMHTRIGDYRQAATAAEQTLSRNESLGDPGTSLQALSSLGLACFYLGKLKEAEQAFQKAAELLDSGARLEYQIFYYHRQGEYYYQLGEMGGAQQSFTKALELARDSKSELDQPPSLTGLAQVAMWQEAAKVENYLAQLDQLLQKEKTEIQVQLKALIEVEMALLHPEMLDNRREVETRLKRLFSLPQLNQAHGHEIDANLLKIYLMLISALQPMRTGSQTPFLPFDSLRKRLDEMHKWVEESGDVWRRMEILGLRSALEAAAGETDAHELYQTMFEGVQAKLSLNLPNKMKASDFARQAPRLRRLALVRKPDVERKTAPEPSLTKPIGDEQQKLETLLEITHLMSTSRDVSSLLGLILDKAIAFTGADRGCLLLIDEYGEIKSLVQRHMEEEIPWTGKAPLSKSIIDDAMREMKPILVDDALSEERYRERASIIEHSLRTIMCAPLRSFLQEGRRPIGVLYVDGQASTRQFSVEDMKLFEALASHAAAAIENTTMKEALSEENRQLKRELEQRYNYGNIIGKSKPMQALYDMLDKVAQSEANVLIVGPSGSGKEMVAKVVHYNSKRSAQPFIGINCAALPESLLERELFGIEKGVATGVEKGIGLLEQAHEGTLFLDEIGDMPLAMQAKLLRVLQERCFRRVGGKQLIHIDIRLLCATNRDLWQAIKESKFREDLLYRIDVITIKLPPLKERIEDIPLLANHFLQRYSEREKKRLVGISEEAMKAMMRYTWPGNVRELENQIERVVSLADENDTISLDDLSDKIKSEFKDVLDATAKERPLKEAVEEYEIQIINQVMTETKGNKSQAAEKLGLSREALRKKFVKYKDRLLDKKSIDSG